MKKKEKMEEASVVEESNKKKTKKSTVHKVKPVVKEEKALFIQRLVAFILDVMIVSVVATFISYPFLDMDSIQKLNDSSVQVMEDFMAQKIDAEEYVSESVSISYEMSRKKGINSLFIIFLNILYFIVFQIKNNGQTLGKQILRIKVVSTTGEELTMNQMIFRALIINSIFMDMLCFGVLIFASQSAYFYGVGLLGFIQFLVLLISGLMVMFSKNKQGVHDLVAHTDVVSCNLVKEMETCES